MLRGGGGKGGGQERRVLKLLFSNYFIAPAISMAALTCLLPCDSVRPGCVTVIQE